MTDKNLADIGVFGGSGFYKFLDNIEEVRVDETPYGMPSDNLFIGKIGEHRVAFMPRHGKKPYHTSAPSELQGKRMGYEIRRSKTGNISMRCRKPAKTRKTRRFCNLRSVCRLD